MNKQPLYPFGYGLSYSTFEYSNLQAKVTDKKRHQVEVTFTLKNTSNRPGAEIAQLYVTDEKCSEEHPLKELKGFEKIMLNPGESKVITLTLDEETFRFFSAKKNKWVLEKGAFTIHVGGSSASLPLKTSINL